MSTAFMTVNRPVSSNRYLLRLVGVGVAYTFAMATGTAVLIGLFASHDDGRVAGANGAKVIAVEVVMQQAAERALRPADVVLAARNLPNDKRGL